MNKLLTGICLFFSILLIGCNGSSDSATSPSQPDASAVATTLVLAVANSQGQAQQSFNTTETITFTATLTDQNSRPLAGQKIDFVTSLGTLSPESKLTDSEGKAIVSVTNSSANIGAATMSASTASLTATVDYEYINGTSVQNQSSLTAELTNNNIAINQFKTDEQVQISATLFDANNAPIVGEIVGFSAEVGTLTTPSALTNAQGVASTQLTGGGSVGAGVLTISYAKTNQSFLLNYQVLAADAVITDPGFRLGYFDNNNDFVEGKIKLSISGDTISAGGTLGLSVDLIDSAGNRVITPTPITFTSSCVANNNAIIDNIVNTINGQATATFEDVKCAGNTGVDDVIIATVNSNDITQTANVSIKITGEQLGSIEFVSASPNSIVLKGTGGQGKQEVSTLTFQVKSALGNTLAQQQVNFSLDTSIGGITLDPITGLTNSQGMITTKVRSGSVPTAVRVTAKSGTGSEEIQTQSDLLSINTGLPEQSSFSLAASLLNPEANSVDGVTSTITAYLADNFNNPVPDGTTVNFTTEGGVIQPSCNTINGSCSVTWTSSNPRVSNHRITILASAIGHETFYDTNGNNVFDNSDGSAINGDDNTSGLSVASGFGRAMPQSSGFIDMSEAWRDDNVNGIRDAGEPFLDFNNNQQFDNRDNLFNGPQCLTPACAPENARSINVRKSTELVMASSSALYQLSADGVGLVASNNGGTLVTLPSIANAAGQAFTLRFSDTADQVMPQGTQVSVSASAGDLAGTTNFEVLNSSAQGGHQLSFVIANPTGGDPAVGTLEINITTPRGVITPVVLVYNLD